MWRACRLELHAYSPKIALKTCFLLVHCHQQHSPGALPGHAGSDCLSNAQDSYGSSEAAQGTGEKTKFPTTAQTEVEAGYSPAVEIFRLEIRSRV